MASTQPQPGAQRLASLKHAGRRPSITARQPPPPKTRLVTKCCDNPQIVEIDGLRACETCSEIIDDSQIVAEVTFGENSAGAAVVQGAYVGEGARYAKTMGGNRRAGGGGESDEQTMNNGRIAIDGLAAHLKIPQPIVEQAYAIYRLASRPGQSFVQGRRVQVVAAACLYAACRREPRNTVMLMDLAQALQVSHFKIGTCYDELRQDLYLADASTVSSIQPFQEPEPLIEKFARKLEFGDKYSKVCEDALKLLARMKRDWMVTGRQPAGICGACIIMAARMNNFRRSTREVVYVVRVAEPTIYQRLQEFKQTVSSRLTIDEFREFGPKIKKSRDPPAFLRARLKEAQEAKEKRHQERREQGEASDTEEEGEEYEPVQSVEPEELDSQPTRRSARQAGVADTSGALPTPENSQRGTTGSRSTTDAYRRDTEGFLIPNPPKPRRGRPPKDRSNDPPQPPRKKRKREPLPLPTPEDLAIEEVLEEEIESIMQDPDVQEEAERQCFEAAESRARQLADEWRNRTPFVPDAEEITADEFDDDPEVAFCKLTPAEVVIKERIWVTANEDWMRAQQARHLRLSLAQAEGGSAGFKKRGKKGSGKGGAGGAGGDDSGAASPAQSPAAAAQNMLARRSGRGLSKYLNYEKLSSVYNKTQRASSAEVSDAITSGAESRVGGRATREASVVEEDDDDDEDEESEDEGPPTAGQTRPTPQQQRPLVNGKTAAAEEEEEEDDDEVIEEDDHLRVMNDPRVLLGGDPDADEDQFGAQYGDYGGESDEYYGEEDDEY
jgi:transcription factor IIIB 90 kDa subunit